MRTFDTIVREVTRRQRSVSGNPRKVLHTDDGVFTTAPDSAVAFAVSDNWWNTPVRVTVTQSGVLLAVERTDDV
jgi:hypothetical protein